MLRRGKGTRCTRPCSKVKHGRRGAKGNSQSHTTWRIDCERPRRSPHTRPVKSKCANSWRCSQTTKVGPTLDMDEIETGKAHLLNCGSWWHLNAANWLSCAQMWLNTVHTTELHRRRDDFPSQGGKKLTRRKKEWVAHNLFAGSLRQGLLALTYATLHAQDCVTNTQMPVRCSAAQRNERGDPSCERGDGAFPGHGTSQEKLQTHTAQNGCVVA